MALEMVYLRTGVWTCLGMDLGGCPHTVTLRHKKASIHSIMTLLSMVNMADSWGAGGTGSFLRGMAPGTGMVPCHSQRGLGWPQRHSTD